MTATPAKLRALALPCLFVATALPGCKQEGGSDFGNASGGLPDDAPGGVPGGDGGGVGGDGGEGGGVSAGSVEGGGEVGGGVDGGGDGGADEWGDGGGDGNEGHGGGAGNPSCSPGPDLFNYALCVCENFGDVGYLRVGSDLNPGQAVVGVNGHTGFVNAVEIFGSLRAYGGLHVTTAGMRVDKYLSSNRDVELFGDVYVGESMFVGGDLTSWVNLEVEDELQVKGTSSIMHGDIGHEAPYTIDQVLPCNCDPAKLFDVAGAVAGARVTNDNAAHGLPTTLVGITPNTTMTLGTGRYYFGDIATFGEMHFVIQGAVSLYLEGDLTSYGIETIELDPGAILDMYVSGAVATLGVVRFGGPEDAGNFRLFIGGGLSAQFAAGRQEFNGSIYAPTVEIIYAGDTRIRGSLFARSLGGIGTLVIEQPTMLDIPPELCPGECSDDPNQAGCQPPAE